MNRQRLADVARRNRTNLKVDLILAIALTLGLTASAATVLAGVELMKPESIQTLPEPGPAPALSPDLVQLARL